MEKRQRRNAKQYLSMRMYKRWQIVRLLSFQMHFRTLFNAFLESDLCKVRAMDVVERVTTSIWPGTTLSLLKFPLTNLSDYHLELRQRRLRRSQNWIRREEMFRKHMYKETSDTQYLTLTGHVGSTFKVISLNFLCIYINLAFLKDFWGQFLKSNLV